MNDDRRACAPNNAIGLHLSRPPRAIATQLQSIPSISGHRSRAGPLSEVELPIACLLDIQLIGWGSCSTFELVVTVAEACMLNSYPPVLTGSVAAVADQIGLQLACRS